MKRNTLQHLMVMIILIAVPIIFYAPEPFKGLTALITCGLEAVVYIGLVITHDKEDKNKNK